MDEDDVERKIQIGQRLASLHAGESRVSFARRLEVSDSTLGNYERGDRYPDTPFLARLRERFGVDLNWLLNAEAVQLQAPPTQVQTQSSAERQIVLPLYDVQASAGAGRLIVSEHVDEYFSVGREWLRRTLPGWAPSNAVVGVLENSGDSMEPTIRDGDLLMVVRDVSWRIVERGGVFVFSLDDRLLLKRLQVLENGDLRIISDNKAYDPWTVKFRELKERLILHGYVFFHGGRPRTFG